MTDPEADSDSSPQSKAGDADNSSSEQAPAKWISRINHGPTAAICALLFVLIGLSLTGFRTYRQYATPDGTFDFAKPGLSDFHNGAYYPSLAFRKGVNPYSVDVCDEYPVSRSAPPYSPVVFMLYAPLTYLSLEQADVTFFAINSLLIGLIAGLGFSMLRQRFEWVPWLWVFGLLIFSRPGHITLVTGYFTAQLVIGSLIAIHFAKTKPFLSGLGMLLASGKPTYILPLTILMLCRKNFRAVGIGLIFCALGAAIGLGWLASHSSFSQVVEGISEGQAALHDDPTEDPVNTWTRLDIAGVVSKIMVWKPDNKIYLATMLLLLVVPGLAVWRNANTESNHGATGLTGMIVCTAMLVTIYHHSYDCLLIAVPWIGLTFFGKRVCPELSSTQRWIVSALLGITAINYASTLKFRDLLDLENQPAVWNMITSINGVCLLLALVILIVAAFRPSRTKIT